MNSLKNGLENFIFMYEGSIEQYLGVEIESLVDKSSFVMNKPLLIQSILDAAQIDMRLTNSYPNPVVGPLLLKN